jgi:hypothetical protein
MRTERFFSVLACGMVFRRAGCGTMNVTTLGNQDHDTDPRQRALLRITVGDNLEVYGVTERLVDRARSVCMHDIPYSYTQPRSSRRHSGTGTGVDVLTSRLPR